MANQGAACNAWSNNLICTARYVRYLELDSWEMQSREVWLDPLCHTAGVERVGVCLTKAPTDHCIVQSVQNDVVA